ncbi:MAG: 16S rRNA (uracil(1498)-N(3))-methyltransferase [Spirochaetales bacterium]|nr:16S rRNA (uracil(1498)-N(3))-methyltransferase [Spirochaetales bacterium]
MNLVLFNENEINKLLPRKDSRATHVMDILKLTPGQLFKAGIINGVQGNGWIHKIHDQGLELEFAFEDDVRPETRPLPITLVCAFTRPQIAKRVLRDATSLGVERMVFFSAQLGEKSYKKASLWEKAEYEAHLLQGAEQVYTTFIPEIELCHSLEKALELVNSCQVIVMEKTPEAVALEKMLIGKKPTALVFGPERGWTEQELKQLAEAKLPMAHLGSRILRTEVAVLGAVFLLRSVMGL